jgi:uncharacterized heparinase superfamily protein
MVLELAATAGPQLVADAERIAAGALCFWGNEIAVDPARPPWQTDPLADRPPDRHADADLKPSLELHRQQHLAPLAAGAALAGREDWARLAIEQLLDWTRRCGPRDRIAWYSGYEAAHRLVGWVWAVPLVSEAAGAEEVDELSESFARQAAFVTARPSRFSSANNHRLAELAGLLAAALVGTAALRWDELWAELERETERQTFADGGSREQASGYFLYVLEILWVAGLFAHASGRGLGRIEERLKAMLGWLEAVADGGGEPPRIGDDAEDRMLRIDYFTPRRATAIAGRVESLLAGQPSLGAVSDRSPAPVSRSLAESGYVVMRGEGVRVVVDVGELGLGTLAAHGHADALSVLVDLDGRPLLRDSGTGLYAPPGLRDSFRVTGGHNTIEIDGTSQAQPLGPHLWGRRYTVELEACSLTNEVDYVRASHDGYRSTPAGALHTRSVTYVRPDLLVVLDRVRAARRCAATLVWQLTGDAEPAIAVQAQPEASFVHGSGPYSTRYGRRTLEPRLTWSANGNEIVFATGIALKGTSPPALSLEHADDVTRVSLGSLRLVENWRGQTVKVER